MEIRGEPTFLHFSLYARLHVEDVAGIPYSSHS